MTTVALNPMPALRAKAVVEVNMRFARIFGSMKYAVHQRKAEQAQAALTGDVAPTFAAEADLRGLKVEDFANLVLSKAKASDGYNEIELKRQRALLAIEAAATPAEIDAILTNKQDDNG